MLLIHTHAAGTRSETCNASLAQPYRQVHAMGQLLHRLCLNADHETPPTKKTRIIDNVLGTHPRQKPTKQMPSGTSQGAMDPRFCLCIRRRSVAKS